MIQPTIISPPTLTFLYQEIRKIVWSFADMARDTGSGTTEDYAKIVIPTCLIKRTLDLQEEFNQKEGKHIFSLVGITSTPKQALEDLNREYGFYDFKANENIPRSVILLTWEHLMSFQDNPNGKEITINLPFEQTYTTTAKNFVEFMFEISDCFNHLMNYVLDNFEFKQKILHKGIVPIENYSFTCHHELSKYKFNMANISTDMFSDMYMDLIGRFAHDSGKKGGEFFTPSPLVQSCWSFFGVEEIAQELISGARKSLKIADPTFGSATFLLYGYDAIMKACDQIKPSAISKEAFKFYGQELKSFQFCLGLTNMIFHGIIDQFNNGIPIEHQNSNVITNYKNGIGKFLGLMDLIVANPPYGTKDYGIDFAMANKNTDSRWQWGVPSKQEGELAFLLTIRDLLNEQGRAVVVMPLGTLFRDGGSDIRQKLIEEDCVEGIVTLPANMFLTTTIPVCLWILNRKKKDADKGKIFMINATDDFVKEGKFNKWNDQNAINAYLARKTNTGFSDYVDHKTIAESGYNLSVSRYIYKEEEKEAVDLPKLMQETDQLLKTISQDMTEMDSVLKQIIAIEKGE